MKKQAVPGNPYEGASLVMKPLEYYSIRNQYTTTNIAVTISSITL